MATWIEKLLKADFERIGDQIYLNGKMVMAMDCICSFQGEYIYDRFGRLHQINNRQPRKGVFS